MERFADRYSVKPSRLNNWNYSTPGDYFITICTYGHNKYFGKIINNKIFLSLRGEIAHNELLKTITLRKNIFIDPWVIMPNHIHLLIRLRNLHVETRCNASLHDNRKITLITHSHKNHPEFFSKLNIKSNQVIPSTIRAFKQSIKRLCNQQHLYFSWQPRYYDHVISNPKELTTVKNYIINNPKNWQKDKFYN